MPGKSKTPDKKIYWDSCVFLHYVNKNSQYLSTLDAILGEVRKKCVVIYTSTLSITEVAFGIDEYGTRKLDNETKDAIDDVLFGGPIKLIEVSRYTTREARELMRESLTGKVIKPADAIHLASAIQLKVPEFQTYDKPLLKRNGFKGLVICEPATTQLALPEDS